MKKRFALLLVSLFLLLALTLFACDKAPAVSKVDYGAVNDFDVNVEDGTDALVYSPKDVKPTVGLIFYVGTFLPATSYNYLGEALAKQGYLVVFPKVLLAFYQYKEEETAYERFKDVRFFLGGHSQGGGAAIRRAQAAPQRTEGLILLAPLCYKYNGSTYDGGGDQSDKNFYNVTETDIPSLVLQAECDRVLSAAHRSAVFECVNPAYCTSHVISPGAHMSFSTADSDSTLKMFDNDGDGISEQGKQAQRKATIELVLTFMNDIASKRA